MFKKKEIFIFNRKSVNATDEDYFLPIELSNNIEPLNSLDSIQFLNVDEQARLERNNSLLYNFITKINFVSLLNGFTKSELESSVLNFNDLLDNVSSNYNPSIKSYDPQIDTLLDIFDIYLCYPKYTLISNNTYQLELIPLKRPSFLLKNSCGFEKNIFGDKTYLFQTKDTLDLNGIVDDTFNLPIMDLYLYFDLKLTNPSIYTYKSIFTSVETNTTKLTSNNNFNGGVIEFNNNDFTFSQTDSVSVNFNITVQKTIPFVQNFTVQFSYNPVLKYNIKSLSSYIEIANQNTLTPIYATTDDNNNVIWRDILDYGFIEPDSGIGNDFPFVNGTHYVYENKTFSINPNMNDFTTNDIFDYLKLNLTEINYKPNKENILKEICSF